MSATISARDVPRTTAFVWWTISAIVTRTVGLVAEHDLAERIADEQHRDAGLVEELRGRVVVGGQHRDPRAVGVQLGDVDDGQAADGRRSWRSCWLPRGLGRAHQSARRRRARPARAATRSSRRSATSRLRQQRQVLARAVGGEDRHAVRVGAEARSPPRRRRWRRAGRRPCAGACRRRARASRSRPRTRRGSGAGRAARASRSPSLSRPRAIRAISARRSGVASSSRVSPSPRSSLRRRRRRPAGSRRRRRP